MPAIDPTKIIVGAGRAYHRALGVVTAWTDVGATMDDTVVRIPQTWFRPDLNGQLGPIQELDYKSEENIEVEFTVMEVSGTNAALVIPGATSTVATGADVGGGLSTTTTAAVAAGATTIPLTATTNLAVGDIIRIEIAAHASVEYHRVTLISSLNVSFRDPLRYAHNSGVAVVEADGDLKTVITGSTVRRMPSTAYKQWALVAEAPNGYYEMLLTSGISTTENAELSFGDDSAAGFRTTIAARYAGASPTTPPWTIRVP